MVRFISYLREYFNYYRLLDKNNYQTDIYTYNDPELKPMIPLEKINSLNTRDINCRSKENPHHFSDTGNPLIL